MNFFKASNIESSEYETLEFLRTAFETARNRQSVTSIDCRLLKRKNGSELIAVNPYSRILWGGAVCRELSSFFCRDADNVDHDQDIFLFTLVNISWARSVSRPDIDLRKMKQEIWSALQGLSFIGFIEPAFYANLERGLFRDKKCIFWHVHSLVWGVSKKQLKQRSKQINGSARFRAIAPNLKSAHKRMIAQGELPKVVSYLLKSPTNAYRIYGFKQDVVSDDTCEMNYQQWKGPMRPGERVSMFHALKHHYLDQLAISGGEGRQLLARIKGTAQSTRKRF
jgi:hypothetical protein